MTMLFCRVSCLTLKMETPRSFKVTTDIYRSTRLGLTGDLNLHKHCHKNFKYRENDRFHIPSPFRYLPTLSGQRLCYCAVEDLP